jgi:hypothetical protein
VRPQVVLGMRPSPRQVEGVSRLGRQRVNMALVGFLLLMRRDWLPGVCVSRSAPNNSLKPSRLAGQRCGAIGLPSGWPEHPRGLARIRSMASCTYTFRSVKSRGGGCVSLDADGRADVPAWR